MQAKNLQTSKSWQSQNSIMASNLLLARKVLKLKRSSTAMISFAKMPNETKSRRRFAKLTKYDSIFRRLAVHETADPSPETNPVKYQKLRTKLMAK
jgi:hypothetical protein